jgi:hypothetical protein
VNWNDKPSPFVYHFWSAEVSDRKKMHCHHNEDKMDRYGQQKEQQYNHR